MEGRERSLACEAISDKEGSVCLRQSVVCLGRSTVEWSSVGVDPWIEGRAREQ